MEEYPIYMGDERIGLAEVTRRGLFYTIRCICDKNADSLLHIQVAGNNNLDLGICVPMGTVSGLITSIPVKRTGGGELRFQAISAKGIPNSAKILFVDEPFDSIDRLKDAYLIRCGETISLGFRITDRSANQPGSDQSP